MKLEIDEGKLKEGVLGLAIALVEIIREALQTQALRRMEGGSLTEAEIERLGRALEDLDDAIEQIKRDHGVGQAVQSVRDELDRVAQILVPLGQPPLGQPDKLPDKLSGRDDLSGNLSGWRSQPHNLSGNLSGGVAGVGR